MKILIIAVSLAVAIPSTGSALESDEILSLVAMPLVVTAVADLIEVPADDLFTLVAELNRAEVPPPQFIEVIRYVPVVLVDATAGPEFATFVTTRIDQGVRGEALAIAIADRMRTLGVVEIDVTAPPVVHIVEREAIPPVVVERVAAIRNHPHGGPPGLIKKEIGVQTGAEVVHGARPGRSGERPVARRGVEAPPANRPPALDSDDGPGKAAGSRGKATAGRAKGQAKGKGKGNR
ncbi:MAG TPA: hypothetical protein VMS56_01010 [Thermoanaerobaculia bacterium]|nr:hypothetical protein [Thermoanaerobaculia bacterium]